MSQSYYNRRRRRRRNKRKITRQMKFSLACAFCCVVLFYIIVIGKIIYLNVVDGDKYKKKVLSQQSYVSSVLNFRRGEIVDKNGTILAVSERVFNVIIDARNIKKEDKDTTEHMDATVAALSKCFHVDEATIRAEIAKKPNSMYIKLDFLKEKTNEELAELKEMMKPHKKEESKETEKSKICGISFEEDYIRKYPLNNVACDLIGFSNKENQGSYGVEESYNEDLNGKPGRKYGYFDTDMNLQQNIKPATNGNNVVMTIDANVQRLVEQYIDNYQKHVGSKNMAVMLMNPNNGDIYAMASYPTYNLNNPRDLSVKYSEQEIAAMDDETKMKNLMELWSNYCLLESYEPGSTFKPFTVAACLEEGVTSDGQSYVCSGAKNVLGAVIKCNNHAGHGAVTVEQSVNKSCNVALMDMGLALGRKKFSKYNSIFGFGTRTGIKLPGEASGMIHTEEGLNPVELATSSFGQTQTVTMIQMMTGFCSLINGGNYYNPRVVKEIQNEKGVTVSTNDAVVVKKTVSEKTSALLRRYLETTVTEGTANPAGVKGYRIGGKTGTAEKRPVSEKNYLVSFIGCVPADDPQVAIYVIIDEPHVEDQAHSTYATEFASKLMKKVLPFLGVYAK